MIRQAVGSAYTGSTAADEPGQTVERDGQTRSVKVAIADVSQLTQG